MLRAIVYTLPLCVLSLSMVLAADNAKLIDAVIRNYYLELAKADELRAKSVDKSKNDALAQLVKLASRAYSEKDRLSETNAWKMILRINRSHPKALQYFQDLGTLEQVLKDLPPLEQSNEANIYSRFVGKWQITYNNEAVETIAFGKTGTHTIPNQPNVKCRVDAILLSESITVTYPGGDHLNRYTLAGDQLLVEQWGPAAEYPKSPPHFFGRAVRVE